MIPEFLLADIGNLPMYCRMFGNRLILLCLIATVCAVMSFNAKAFSMTPVIVFGAGIILVLILMGLDHKKYKSKE